MWAVIKPLRPHALSVGQARNFCTRRLGSVLDGRNEPDEAIADSAAVASELVTNAVRAGAKSIELFLQLSESSVRIEVSDDAAGEVRPVTPAPTDTAGRGLLVVAALARDWGVTVPDSGRTGKQVWADVAIPPRAAVA